MNKCLYCFQPLAAGNYHSNCSKQLFGESLAPQLTYRLKDLKKLAKELVLKSVAVPGVQQKLSIHLNKTQKQSKLTFIGLFGDYILKPPSAVYPQLSENEALTMNLAKLFGIATAKNGLVKLASGELAYIVKRMDRVKDQKIHMEDFCQLSGKLTEDKYKGSVEQIVNIIKKYSANPMLDVLAFFELILFCYITGNNDMHLKNFSLIYHNNGITLAPAYDLLNVSLVLSKKVDPEESALTINGKKRKLTAKDFLIFATQSGLNMKQIENVIKKFQANLGKATSLINNSFLNNEFRGKYLEIFIENMKLINLMSK